LQEYNYEKIKISLTEEKKEEEDLNPNKIFEENLKLKKENNRLVERVKYLENEIEFLKSFLPYYLDKSLFLKLKSSQIIKEVQQLELINRGISNLFQKNIKDIIFKYKFNAQDQSNSLSFFSNIYKYLGNLTNILLVVKTTKNRSFGAFYQIFRNDYNYNYNKNYNNIIYANVAAPRIVETYSKPSPEKNIPSGNQITVQNDYFTMNYNMAYGQQYGQQSINNIKYNINIDPVQYPNSFFFSLDHLKIYNSNNSQFNISENPSFIIEYNNDKKIFWGTKKKNNEIGKIIMNIGKRYGGGAILLDQENKQTTKSEEIDYSFILSNQEQFENFILEIYEIKI
jgi:hypothetical protein